VCNLCVTCGVAPPSPHTPQIKLRGKDSNNSAGLHVSRIYLDLKTFHFCLTHSTQFYRPSIENRESMSYLERDPSVHPWPSTSDNFPYNSVTLAPHNKLSRKRRRFVKTGPKTAIIFINGVTVYYPNSANCRSKLPRGLRHGSAAARLLGLRKTSSWTRMEASYCSV